MADERIEWPRERLVSVLAELADKRSQNIWLGQESGPGTSELTPFSHVLEVLFDEHDFERPACVGETLYVEDEREALLELMDVLYSIGPIGDESNEQLLTHRKWPKVVEAARKAHAVLTEEDNKRRKS